ncbi:zinc-dependent alcohol dehydrogenase family protein [Terriglobus tenax]|uniref:zinc-dependent alcohol dehydrogenase family protein n=1 Tax=Terriglobus tenax TaxID=1111115 RepID=UPI0021DFF228|nr:NAD(P)-dependent alcohol dehydrogenase [Terriglobus tenax]
MKAWQLTGFGLDALRLNDIPDPSPAQGEVLVQVHAVSLNYRDKLLMDGGYNPRLEFPITQGADACGTVVGLGPGTSRFRLGDRVLTQYATHWVDGPAQGKESLYTLGNVYPGALAKYLVLREQALVMAPAHLSDEEAATLPCAGVTAWQALIEKGGLRAGDTVLLQGTGGVSLFGLQIAHSVGATTIVTSSSDQKLERVVQMGADETINYTRTPEWDKEALELTGKRGVDHILEVVGGENLAQSLRALRPEGQISIIGVLESTDARLPMFTAIQKQAVIRGISTGPRVALERFLQKYEALGLYPAVDAVYDFKDAHAAYQHLDAGPFGKVVIRVA